ncbi:MAG: hypothetical protein J5994_11155 [Ruminococcus sp.]|nr:hypothetical protein [Ruminococcus sp.]
MGIITLKNVKEHSRCGTKAQNLFLLKSADFNVPDFFCTDGNFSISELDAALDSLGGELFSVRSSADCEDGEESSYAGQFRTFLNVPKADVRKRIGECVSYNGGKEYARAKNIRGSERVFCIVQKMLCPQLSGVIFTVNPNGRLNETVISIGRGLGESVVSGRGACTNYYINRSDGSRWYESGDGSPIADERLIQELTDISREISDYANFPADIEFAVENGEIFILQVRRITAVPEGERIILDSSNICESYPGVSLPLTQDFVSAVYYGVFRSVVKRLTGSEDVAKRLDGSLKKMTDCADGRIYYRISGWYDILRLLPFSEKIIPVWQDMLGIEDREITSGFRAGLSVKLTVTVRFFDLLFTNNLRMKRLKKFFRGKISLYRREIDRTDGAENLMRLYVKIRREICSVWDITLVNDMYTFIYTGMLKAILKKRLHEKYEKVLSQSIYGGGELESMKPVKALGRLKLRAERNGLTESLKNIRSREDYFNFRDSNYDSYGRFLDKYISLYGDRAPEELKLEAKTPRTAPEILVKMILSANTGKNVRSKRHTKLTLPEKLIAGKAKKGVAQRERSRLDRARLYGVMRDIIRKAAGQLKADGKLEETDDIFYLSCKEIVTLDRGADLRGKIAARKALYSMYADMPSPRRIVFAGEVRSVSPANVNSVPHRNADGIFHGTACSGGIVTAEVVKLEDPSELMTKNVVGKIVAAKMTDPGWVSVIAKSAGLICERGSLLSHTAIISRELKKPAAVGIQGFFDAVQDGCTVTLNGFDGTVTINTSAKKT